MDRHIISTQERSRRGYIVLSLSFLHICMSKRNARKGEKKPKTKTEMTGIIAQLISNTLEKKRFREKNVTQKCQEIGQRAERSIIMVR